MIFYLAKIYQLFSSEYKIKINIPWILFYIFFIVYGFFGSFTGGTFLFQIFFTLFIILIQISLWFFAKNNNNFSTIVVLKFVDFFKILIPFIVIAILNQEYFQISLTNDDLSYAQSSIVHSLKTSFLITEKTEIFNQFQFDSLLNSISALIFLTLIIFFAFVCRVSTNFRLIIILLSTIVLRFIMFKEGGNTSPHPPLALIPSFVYTSIFGISDSSFRIAYHLTYILFSYLLYNYFIQNSKNGLQTVISIISLPLLWRLSISNTPSLWSSLIFITILVLLFTNNKKNYFNLISIASIGFLFRIPTMIIFIPIILFFLYELWKFKNLSNKILKQLFPVIITFPFLLILFLNGTPATNFSISSISIADKLMLALDSGIVFYSIYNNFEIWTLLFVPIAFIMSKGRIILVTFLLVILMVFYSIRIELWGSAKYQAEIIIPFISLGMHLLFKKMKKISSTILACILVIFNLVSISYYPNRINEWQIIPLKNKLNEQNIGLIEEIYDFSKAYEIIEKNMIDKSIYTANNNYGIMPEIMAGFNVKEIIRIKNIRSEINTLINEKGIKSNQPIISILNNYNKVKTIVIGVKKGDQEDFLEEIKKNLDWEIRDELKNKRFKNFTYILTRKIS